MKSHPYSVRGQHVNIISIVTHANTMWAAKWALIIDTCLCVCVCVNGRYHVLVPAEWLSAGLIRPRPQTQSLSYSLSGLRVPVWRLKRFTGAERLLEVEFQQPDMEFTQVSAEFVGIFENWVQWKRSVATLTSLTGSDGQTETYKVVVPDWIMVSKQSHSHLHSDTCWLLLCQYLNRLFCETTQTSIAHF